MRKLLVASVGLVALAFAPVKAHATTDLVVDSASYAQSPTTTTTGFVDVYFHIVGTNTSNPLAGYQIKVNATPVGTASGLTITGTANPSSPHAPIFPSTPPTDSSTSTYAQATAFLSSGANAITDQEGLIQINYSLAAGAQGSYALAIDPVTTDLADNNSLPIAYVPVAGSISVAPEPSSLALLLGVVGVPLLRRRRAAM